MSSDGKKVMVVEDEADIRTMMTLLLSGYGFQVIEAADGYEAVKKAVEEPPDLILMDMAMPVLDGLACTRVLRTHDSLDRVPIVAVTAYGDFYADRAREAGCSELVSKPIDFDQLKPMVERYVN